MISCKGSSATKGILYNIITKGILIRPGNCHDFNDSSFCNIVVIDSICNFKDYKGCTNDLKAILLT